MSAWHGPHRRGAMKDRRTVKRAEAEDRNACTKRSRRRKTRLKGAHDPMRLAGIPVVALPDLPPDIVAIVAPGQDPVVFRLPDAP